MKSTLKVNLVHLEHIAADNAHLLGHILYYKTTRESHLDERRRRSFKIFKEVTSFELHVRCVEK